MFSNKFFQAMYGLTFTRSDRVVKVNEVNDPWLCTVNAFEAVANRFKGEPPLVPDMLKIGDAKRMFRDAITGPLASKRPGRTRGDTTVLVRQAIEDGLITRAEAPAYGTFN